MSPGKPRLSRKVASSKTTTAETQTIPIQADAFAPPPSAPSEVASNPAPVKPKAKPAPAFDAAAVAAAIFAGVAAMGHSAPPKPRRSRARSAAPALPEPAVLNASAVVPDAAVALPEARSVLPEAPAAMPEAPAALPEASVALPGAPVVLPEASAAVPAAIVTLPEARVALPEAKAPLPEATLAPEVVRALPEPSLALPEIAAAVMPASLAADALELPLQSITAIAVPIAAVAAPPAAKPRKRAAPRAKAPALPLAVAMVEPILAAPIELIVATPVEPILAAPIELIVATPVAPIVAPTVEPVVELPIETSAQAASPGVLKLSLVRKTAAPKLAPAVIASIEASPAQVEVAPPPAKFEAHVTPAMAVPKPRDARSRPPQQARNRPVAASSEPVVTQALASVEAVEPIAISVLKPPLMSTEPFSPPMSVVHRVHPVALGRKREVLEYLLAQTPESPSLVYTRTKHGADKIARFLERAGFKAAAIHGDKSHGARARALEGFKNGGLNALVITDIAARLLDVHGLQSVLSYDLPHIAEDYTLRVLRTGTAHTPGLAITIITQEESVQFRAMRDLLQSPIELLPLAGFEGAEPFDPERDPIVRAEVETTSDDAGPVAAPVEVKREDTQRVRRDRRGRPIREPRPRDTAPVEVEPATLPVISADGEPGDAQPGDAQPTEATPTRPLRAPRADRHGDRKARAERPPRGERPPREAAAREAAPREATPREATPRTERPPARADRPVRADRKLRADRPFRGDRQPRAPRGDEQPLDDRQPFFDSSPVPDFDDDDGPTRGNSLAAPPSSQINANIAGSRRGRRDPFATVVIDEDRANIYDERQPDTFRDQWSVLGPDTNRPSWTYAEHEPQLVADSVVRAPITRSAPPGRRKGPGPAGQAGRGQPAEARGPQRPGRSRRAEGR